MTPVWHLAQANIARMRAPLDDPLMADFVAQLEPVNALAESSPGFVWRLETEDGDATAIRVFDDDRLLLNMSVWTSIEALRAYAFGGGHAAVMRQRSRWFVRMRRSHAVLWWIDAGAIPTVADAEARFRRLWAAGPTPDAFTFAETYPPPDATAIPPRSDTTGRTAR